MILLEDNVVKYRDGTMKSLKELTDSIMTASDVEDITDQITVESTVGIIRVQKAVKSGNIVSINFSGKNTEDVEPLDIWSRAGISGLPIPIMTVNTAFVYSQGGVLGQLVRTINNVMSISMRVFDNAARPANNSLILTITYLTSDTINEATLEKSLETEKKVTTKPKTKKTKKINK